MPIDFGSIGGAHFISSFRAFVHDDGMPGVRVTKEDGSSLNLVFSVPGIQELQKQLALAEQMASPQSRH
ncbi:hypothetical protein UFOVP241_37 [uncultured Caudovirales phage]|uniref:Uncharacterized protein n=1 Tax=uncultured Caudovirales phage TaxID=2100421 RepID=A0A6J7WS83_9CAUD|nr:hypothetical protein UFOVP241_37 [uncultured Caudovirales phage]